MAVVKVVFQQERLSEQMAEMVQEIVVIFEEIRDAPWSAFPSVSGRILLKLCC